METRREFLEARYYETYYFANVVRNVLHDQFAYIRNLDEFYGDERFLNFVTPFPKYSALHAFIEFAVVSILFEDLAKVDLDNMRREANRYRFGSSASNRHDLEVNRALRYYGIEHLSFDAWLSEKSKTFESAHEDDAYDYFNDLQLEGPIDALLERTVAEVFFVLFQNRGLLQVFNEMLAGIVADSELSEVPLEMRPLFKRAGVLKRVHIPAWVQKAVFFRDRGLCVLCRRDISGLVSIGAAKNFDHIVPLAGGGLNDVTNVQLLCERCNSEKGAKGSHTSEVYEAWY